MKTRSEETIRSLPSSDTISKKVGWSSFFSGRPFFLNNDEMRQLDWSVKRAAIPKDPASNPGSNQLSGAGGVKMFHSWPQMCVLVFGPWSQNLRRLLDQPQLFLLTQRETLGPDLINIFAA